MSKRIAYTRTDGALAIVTPALSHNDPTEMTAEEALSRAIALLPADGVDALVIDESDLPTDRVFREAWRLAADGAGGRITIDMERAREIHMNRIRRARDVELAKLDIDFMRAIEAGDLDEQAEIALHKQRLRDTPQAFDLSGYATPEELKEAWPVDLDRSAD